MLSVLKVKLVILPDLKMAYHLPLVDGPEEGTIIYVAVSAQIILQKHVRKQVAGS